MYLFLTIKMLDNYFMLTFKTFMLKIQRNSNLIIYSV